MKIRPILPSNRASNGRPTKKQGTADALGLAVACMVPIGVKSAGPVAL